MRNRSFEVLKLPSQEYLLNRLHYNPETGKLKWRNWQKASCKWASRYADKEAFTTRHDRGYLIGRIDSVRYYAHRIIYKMQTGEEPEFIDHINGVKSDNRFENLRSVSKLQNARNRPINKNRSGAVMGVCWHKRDQRWRAQTKINGVFVHIGNFDTQEEAASAYLEKIRSLGFHKNHGRQYEGIHAKS